MGRVLIGFEQSGVVRRAFAARGFDAWSVDVLPSEDRSNKHIVGDIRDHLNDGWDLIAVFHPPCTRLCNSGVRWLKEPPTNPPADCSDYEREWWHQMDRLQKLRIMWRLLDEAAELFSDVWNADCPRIAVENPVMHKHAKARIKNFEPASQTVQPWWFGEEAFKATGLYLRNLPDLVPTDKLSPPKKAEDPDRHRAWSFIHMATPGADRWKLRSKTFQGVADAMADQWGALLPQPDMMDFG